jgi:hypothetical protein
MNHMNLLNIYQNGNCFEQMKRFMFMYLQLLADVFQPRIRVVSCAKYLLHQCGKKSVYFLLMLQCCFVPRKGQVQDVV